MLRNMSSSNKSLVVLTYNLIGATTINDNHFVLRTSLSAPELPSLWLAIGVDFLYAGNITGLQYFPAMKTDFGLRIGHDPILDLVARDTPWFDSEMKMNSTPSPAILLAGLPGSGKSTIANELQQIVSVGKGATFTNRDERPNDIDFERGQFLRLDSRNICDFRRSPIYGYPVIFRGKVYIFNAASLIERFDHKNRLAVYTDSHYFRVNWRKRLMSDIRIVWLEAPESILKERVKQRGTDEIISDDYLAGCLRTKLMADITLDTHTLSSTETAQELLSKLKIYV